MEQLAPFATPAVMMLLMTVVGLELTVADFQRVIVRPLPSLTGIVGAVTLLPLLAWAMISLFDITGSLAAGLILMAACPGGGLSNVLVFVARANVALSVTLTAVHSVLAVVTMPFIAGLGFHYIIGKDYVFDVPTGELVLTLLITVLVPVALGMLIRAKAPEWTQKNARSFGRTSLILLLLLILGNARGQDADFFSQFGPATQWAIVWVIGSMILAALVGWATTLPMADTLAIIIEFAARNVALAITVGVGVLKDPDLAVFPSAVAIVALPPSFLVIAWFRARNKAS